MNTCIKSIFFLCLLVLMVPAVSQELLTLEQAKEITLANNFNIRIAKNNVTIAENQTDRGFNNYLPSVSANGGVNGDFGSSNQSFNNGNEASVNNAFNWGLSASLNANYTIYDQARNLTMQQLKEALNASDLELRQIIEQNLLQVYTSYFVVSQLAENIEVLEQTIDISKERLKRARYDLDLGQGTGLNILNAEVDIQQDSLNLLSALVNLDTEKRNLNIAMGRSADINFDIDKGSDIAYLISENTLIEKAVKENITLQLNRQNLLVSEIGLGLIDTERRPTVSSSLSYNGAFSDNAPGAFITQSRSNGLNGGINLNWTLFDGTRKIRRQNAELNLSNQKLQLEALEQQLRGNIRNTWQAYQNELFIIEVQQKAVATNEENFERTKELLRSGRVTSIEFRQAQLNLLNAKVNLTNAIYAVKSRIIQLKQLAGEIME